MIWLKKKSRRKGKIILLLMIMVGSLNAIPTQDVKAIESASKKNVMTYEYAKNVLNPTMKGSSYEERRLKWNGNYLYWGNDSYYGDPLKPFKWQILNTVSTEYTEAPAGETEKPNGMLLYSQGMERTLFGSNNTYEGSKLDVFLNTTKYDANLSTKEKGITLNSKNEGGSYETRNDGLYQEEIFSGKKWFAPTGKILSTPEYGYSGDTKESDWARTSFYDRYYYDYWLSSSNERDSNRSAYITTEYGDIDGSWSDSTENVARAVTNLDVKSIVFVSEATNGKTGDGIVDANLANSETTTSNEYKLTIKDTTQSISLSNVKREKNKISFDYSKTGDGTSVSAIITDKTGDEIISYDQIQTVGTGNQIGSASVILPDDFDTNNYKLKVFTEENTGAKTTDYASELVEAMPTQFVIPFEYKDINGVLVTTETEFTLNDIVTYPTLEEINGYRFNKWTINPSNGIEERKLVKFFTATADYIKTYTYEYQDEDGNTLLTETVDTGTDISKKAPVAPIKDGYTFDYWSYSTTDITFDSLNKDFIAKAVYKLNASTPEDKPGDKPSDKPSDKPIIKPEEPTTPESKPDTTPENKPSDINTIPDTSNDTVKTSDQANVASLFILMITSITIYITIRKKHNKI